MIINLGWKNIQKNYIREKGVHRLFKNKIQSFMTNSELKSVALQDDDKIQFIFEFNNKNYAVKLDGDYTCGIKLSMYRDFGPQIQPELLPYLREYKHKYMKQAAMFG